MDTLDHKRRDADLLTETPAFSRFDAPTLAQPARSRGWMWGVALVAVIAAGSAVAFTQWPGRSAGSAVSVAASPPPATPVSVAVVEQRDTTIWTAFSGRPEAVNRVEIRPRAAGRTTAEEDGEGASGERS